MAATTQPRDPNNLPSIVANSDGTAGVLGLDTAGNLNVRAIQGGITTATQVTVTTTPGPILAANPARKDLLISVISGSVVYLGGSNAVAPGGATGGVPLSPGNAFGASSITGAIYGVCASGTALVSAIEVS